MLGTVQDYLDQQGAEPFFRVGDRYGVLYAKMLTKLEDLDPSELDRRAERRNTIDVLPAETLASFCLDVDGVLNNSTVDLAQVVDEHIQAIESWLDAI